MAFFRRSGRNCIRHLIRNGTTANLTIHDYTHVVLFLLAKVTYFFIYHEISKSLIAHCRHSCAHLYILRTHVCTRTVRITTCAAVRTRPTAGCKSQFLELVTAGGTRLRGLIEGADLCKDPAFMLRLVFALAHEFSPSGIGNRLCKKVILHHALNFQSLENQRWVFVHQSSRGLVKEIAVAALHLAVQFCRTLASLLPILAPLLLSGEGTARLPELFLGHLERFGRLDLFTVGACAEGLDADVDSNRFGVENACRRYGFGQADLVENASSVVAAGIHRKRDALDLALIMHIIIILIIIICIT